MLNENKLAKLNTILDVNELRKVFNYHPMFTGVKLHSSNWDSDANFENVRVSIVMPIYNKSNLLEEQLRFLINNLSDKTEIIIIDDASLDDSVDKAASILKNNYKGYYTILVNNEPIYETACDNLGFYLSSGDYVCEVQSDILINESNFDTKMLLAMEEFGLSSISGRCGHVWSMLYPQPNKTFFQILYDRVIYKYFYKKYYVGKAGAKGFSKSTFDKGVYLVNTNNRGPWMINRNLLKNLGYLDQVNFFLGDDDHDLNYKITNQGGRIGFVNINSYSRESDGSSRQPRVGLNKEIYDWYYKNKYGSKNLIDSLKNSVSDIPPICLSKRK